MCVTDEQPACKAGQMVVPHDRTDNASSPVLAVRDISSRSEPRHTHGLSG